MAENKQEHVEFQKSFFDHNVDVFRKPIPEDVIERSREIARAVIKSPADRILDVGTGLGAFLRHYNESGVSYSNIVGCDLSTEMLKEAKLRFPQVQFWQGDVIELPASFGNFDLVVFNACFGNIFDQFAVLKKTRDRLNTAGRIAISHPMGNAFVAQLKEAEPRLIYTLLPDKASLEKWAKDLEMRVELFRDEELLYLAILSCE